MGCPLLLLWSNDGKTLNHDQSYSGFAYRPWGARSGSKQNSLANIDYINFSRVDALTMMQLDCVPGCLFDMWDYMWNVDVGLYKILYIIKGESFQLSLSKALSRRIHDEILIMQKEWEKARSTSFRNRFGVYLMSSMWVPASAAKEESK